VLLFFRYLVYKLVVVVFYLAFEAFYLSIDLIQLVVYLFYGEFLRFDAGYPGFNFAAAMVEVGEGFGKEFPAFETFDFIYLLLLVGQVAGLCFDIGRFGAYLLVKGLFEWFQHFKYFGIELGNFFFFLDDKLTEFRDGRS